MFSEQIKVLLVEDNPGDARLMQETLDDVVGASPFTVECTDRLSSALDRISAGDIDLVILDLTLPDGYGLDTFEKAHLTAPDMPIVVISSLNDQGIALQAVRRGAQDYLVKGHLDGHQLARSLRYAVERHRVLAELRDLALLDDLTGLYNRRGFMLAAEQQWQLALRNKREMLLLYADLDNLKQINDTFGHRLGDQALIDAATVLREAFRKSDILARLGGDEFAILVIEAAKDSEHVIVSRLDRIQKRHNAKSGQPFELTVSVGAAHFDPDNPASLEDLMIEADRVMYRRKHDNKAGR